MNACKQQPFAPVWLEGWVTPLAKKVVYDFMFYFLTIDRDGHAMNYQKNNKTKR